MEEETDEMAINTLHTEFLVHWTGKDFHDPPINDLNDALRDHYVDRLVDGLTNGLCMNPGTEQIYGPDGTWIKATISRTCFTEIKLTQAQAHAFRYGRLGIGVHRQFVMERHGNPVFYVQNGDDSAIVANMDRVRGALSQNPTALRQFEVLLAFAKNMSERSSADLRYYDELEWRIVHLDRLERRYLKTIDKANGIFRVVLDHRDVKLVVFPDERTKHKAIADSRLQAFLKTGPILVTLDDCQQF